MLHGWGVNSLIWQPVRAQLESSFDLTMLDLPGYGSRIDYRGDYKLASVVADVLDRAPARAIWIGWSLGGTIALAAALDHPERFSKLQLLSATPCFLLRDHWSFGIEVEPFEKLAVQFDQNYQKALKKFLLLQANTGDRSRITATKSLVRELSDLMLTVPAPNQTTLQGGLNILREVDLRSRLNELVVQSQVVAGIHDRVVPLSASKYLSDQIPDCRNICPLDAGHLPFIEARSEYVRLLSSFANT